MNKHYGLFILAVFISVVLYWYYILSYQPKNVIQYCAKKVEKTSPDFIRKHNESYKSNTRPETDDEKEYRECLLEKGEEKFKYSSIN
jgi:hypothetical protein